MEITLFCALVGVAGSAFPVDIDKKKLVGHLKNAIKAILSETIKGEANKLRLFLAKSANGKKWLDHVDPAVLEVKKGNIHPDVQMLIAGEELDEMCRIDEVLKENHMPTIQSRQLHVLVVVPKQEEESVQRNVSIQEWESATFRVGIDAEKEQYIVPYSLAAEELKHTDEVAKLEEAIKRVDEYEGSIFIVLESSLGMGKTQMAFNLMASNNVQVYYLVCESTWAHQSVDAAFRSRSVSFRLCVELDYWLTSEAKVVEIGGMGKLFTYGFILALLSGTTKFRGRGERDDVYKAVKARKANNPCVFFLDEFPLVNDDRDREKYIRFMRNVFRALDLVVILSCTNGAARKLITTSGRFSHCDNFRPLWCVVVPSFLRFRTASMDRIPNELKAIVVNSRPLFAQKAFEYIVNHPFNEKDVVEYMNEMSKALGNEVIKGKKHSMWGFLAGQVYLLIGPSDYIEIDRVNLIHGHFARLSESEPFDLHFEVLNDHVKMVKDNTKWKCQCVFPPMKEDILLYLILMGGQGFRPFVSLPFYQALNQMEETTQEVESEGITYLPWNDKRRFEALVLGSIVLASHKSGYAGIGFDAFLAALLYELGFVKSLEDDWIVFPLKVREFVVSSSLIPFLSPPNVKWPPFLPKRLNLGHLERMTDRDGIDVFISSDNILSFEYHHSQKNINFDEFKKILTRVPKHTTFHLVLCKQSLHRSYCAKGSTFDELVAHEQLIWLQHAWFYRMKKTARKITSTGKTKAIKLEQIEGIQNKCRKPNCTSCRVEKLVIFIERAGCGLKRK